MPFVAKKIKGALTNTVTVLIMTQLIIQKTWTNQHLAFTGYFICRTGSRAGLQPPTTHCYTVSKQYESVKYQKKDQSNLAYVIYLFLFI